MFLPPQQQNTTGALARKSAYARPNLAPAYYLGRPASLWISVTTPAPLAHRTPGPCGRPHRQPGTKPSQTVVAAAA